MSVFGSIMSRIFGHQEAAASTGGAQPPAARAGEPSPSAATPSAASQPTATPTMAGAAAPASTTQSQPVDVEAVLSGMAEKNPQKLNWRQSIVDLMKLLDLDSSLGARTELAKELDYNGDTQDSAAMNIWLHKQVMQKLADNGGKVPDSLRT